MRKKQTTKQQPKSLGERVKAYRYARGYWTQEQMALHCGVSVVTIRRAEGGDSLGPVATDKLERAMAGQPPKAAGAIAKEAKAS